VTLRLGVSSGSSARAVATGLAARADAELVVLDGEPREALARGEIEALVAAYAEIAADRAGTVMRLAVPRRADAHDLLHGAAPVSGLAALPDGARVGVGTALRRAQLRSRHPGLVPVAIDSPEAEARIVSSGDPVPEGLVSSALDLDDWSTAPAQGAVAIEVPAGARGLASLRALDHRASHLLADAEHGVRLALLAGPDAPLAARAILDQGLLLLTATVFSPDGSERLTSSHALYAADVRDPAEELAQRVAEELRQAGAARHLASAGASTEDS